MKSPQNFPHPYNTQADIDASSRSPQIHTKRQSGPCWMLAAYPWQCCGHLVLPFVTLQERVLFITAGPSTVPISSVSRATSVCSLVPMLRILSLFQGFFLVTQIASQGPLWDRKEDKCQICLQFSPRVPATPSSITTLPSGLPFSSYTAYTTLVLTAWNWACGRTVHISLAIY